jgi:ADP-ribosylglycohydrolase
MPAVYPFPFTPIQSGKPLPAKELLRSPGQSPISWEIIVPARRRERALEGVFVGCAVAEAINQVVCTPDIYAARKAANRLLKDDGPMFMMPNHRLHAMVLTIQSLLLSRASIDRFATALRWRLRYYRAGRPFALAASRVAGFLNTEVPGGLSPSLGTDPLARAAILSVVLQGHSHGGVRWVQRSTVSTHRDALVTNSAMLVAIAMQAAQIADSEFEVPRDQLLQVMSESTSMPELKDRLLALAMLLKHDRPLLSAARLLGFVGSVPPSIVDAALLGIYAWLRYRGNFRRTVEEVTMLGGDVCSAAVVGGALAGAELGVEGIPIEWVERTIMDPHDAAWRELYIERLRDWPHGPEDIQRTKHLPIMPLGQLRRNLFFAWWWMTLPFRRAAYRVSHGEGKHR